MRLRQLLFRSLNVVQYLRDSISFVCNTDLDHVVEQGFRTRGVIDQDLRSEFVFYWTLFCFLQKRSFECVLNKSQFGFRIPRRWTSHPSSAAQKLLRTMIGID